MREKLVYIVLLASAMFSPLSAACAKNFACQIRWFGQGCFFITSPKGVKILVDPVGGKLYQKPSSPPDIILISHEHSDSNNTSIVGSSTRVIHGLKDEGSAFNPVNETLEDVTVRNVLSFHDKSRGALRGLNSIFLIKVGEIRFVHLGNLGNTLKHSQVLAIGKPVDVLIIPVGGFYVINYNGANEIIQKLKPRITIPMYYSIPANSEMNLDTVDSFLRGKKNIIRVKTATLKLDYTKLPAAGTTFVMRWKKKEME